MYIIICFLLLHSTAGLIYYHPLDMKQQGLEGHAKEIRPSEPVISLPSLVNPEI